MNDRTSYQEHLAPPEWASPDLTVLRLNPAPAPDLPLDCFGFEWAEWIVRTAKASACRVDYVALPLLAAASALIGNARWPCLGGWTEPPNLWIGSVGFSGDGKTPGASCLMRDVLPALEKRMGANLPNQILVWETEAETAKAARSVWEKEVAEALKKNMPPPLPPTANGKKPEAPRLKVNDVTIERAATLLADCCPKGLLMERDELAGLVLGMNAYHDGGRQFYLEAWNGGPYRVERVKTPDAILIPRTTIALYGGIQPPRLADLSKGADDGLFARFLWGWPDTLLFKLGCAADPGWAIEALDKLRLLEMQCGGADGELTPVSVPLDVATEAAMEAFGQKMQQRQREAGILLGSAFAKARGHALRLSLVLEYLWWCGSGAQTQIPGRVSVKAFCAATEMMDQYFLPNAERVYDGAGGHSDEDRRVTRLARWIVDTKAPAVHVRTLLRGVRLPGLTDAEAIHAAAGALIEASWLMPPDKGRAFQGRGSMTYRVNPAVHAFTE